MREAAASLWEKAKNEEAELRELIEVSKHGINKARADIAYEAGKVEETPPLPIFELFRGGKS